MRRFADFFRRPTILKPLIAVFILLFSTLLIPLIAPNSTSATSVTDNPSIVAVTPAPGQPTQGEPTQPDPTNPPASQPTDTTQAEPSEEEVAKSCAEQTGAVGWIVCPSGSLLVTIIDGIYNVIVTLLELKPITSEDNSPIYMVWSYMRDVANITLVIAMIIAIISQVSGFGISNYGIKKLLPKLVIGAILLNLSFVICAVAVDLSNVLGYSLGGVFDGIRDRIIMSGTMNAAADVSFGDLLVPLFAGGALTIGGVAMAGGLGAALWLALPIILGGVIAVIAALITIAARQAVIYILIMIAPLAFAAYLLPNMDKWFDKWRKLFTQMLVLFPLFTVLFGASRLAAMAIIASSDHVYHVLLGVAVQLFPLFFAPSLFKMSNSVIGKVNDMVRKPFGGMQRGVGEYAKGKSEAKRARNAANPSALRPSSYLTAFLERQKALAADDRQTAADILAGQNKAYVNRKKSFLDKDGNIKDKFNSRQKTALKAMEASKEAETTSAQLKFGMEDYVIGASRAVASLDKDYKDARKAAEAAKTELDPNITREYDSARAKAVRKYRTALNIKELDTQLQAARVSDKAKELAVEMEAGDYALDPKNYDRLYGPERGAASALVMAAWLKKQKAFKDLRTDMEIEIINKYDSSPTELRGDALDFLSGKTDTYELKDFSAPGTARPVMRVVNNNIKDDTEFVQALIKTYLLKEADPKGIVDIIVANEVNTPASGKARNLVVNRKMANGWLKDTGAIADNPFMNGTFISRLNDGAFSNHGIVYKTILETMDQINAKKWAGQSKYSAAFLEDVLSGKYNNDLLDPKQAGINPDELSALTEGALKRILEINRDMTNESRNDMQQEVTRSTLRLTKLATERGIKIDPKPGKK